MFIRARAKAFARHNICSGWRSTGLEPLSPVVVLEKLAPNQPPYTAGPSTPPEQLDLDYALLDSSVPDGTELQQANLLLNSTLKAGGALTSPAKRYIERVTRSFGTTHSELVLARRQNDEYRALLGTRKQRTKGKRVALQGKFVFSTKEVLEIAKAAEAETSARKISSQPRKRRIEDVSTEDGIEVSEEDSSNPDSSCIVVAARK